MINYKKLIRSAILVFLGIFSFYAGYSLTSEQTEIAFTGKVRSTSSPKAAPQSITGRLEYFNRLLKDPKLGKIPDDAFEREMEVVSKIPNRSNFRLEKANAPSYVWKEAGPYDVGGRTRALAVDVKNSNTILAGGVSGGIWKSTNKGQSWSMKTRPGQRKSVSCIAQDTRDGHTDTWYAGTGEIVGNSASDVGSPFRGNGIFKSNDNGETWERLTLSLDEHPVGPYGSNLILTYSLNIKVHPISGNVFVACSDYGILKSTDGGTTFTESLVGDFTEHRYNDLDIASDGTLIATLDNMDGIATQHGIFKSTNEGESWQDITPASFPDEHYRTVIGFAPSNPTVAYSLTLSREFENNEFVEYFNFYKFNVPDGTSEDRTQNLPNITGAGELNAQTSYNMVLKVKPDNENFVLFGLTNLYRSSTGFATSSNDERQNWIGGYRATNNFASHFNHHPDQHSLVFDPNNPSAVWSGHDGGLSYTGNITQTNYPLKFPWDSKNNGYNVTQYYTASIHPGKGNSLFLGGTQDNGSPVYTSDGNSIGTSRDISSGDGSFCYLGPTYSYVSTQYGSLLRTTYNSNGQPRNAYGAGGTEDGSWAFVTPTGAQGAQGQLFINPFVVDPNNDAVMYYLDGSFIWRNLQLSSIPAGNQSATSQGWEKLVTLESPSGLYSAISVSKEPANVLYYAAYTDGVPKLWRLSNSKFSTAAVEKTITGAEAGAYVTKIAINPADADEILVVMSNYGINGIFHSTNGGNSFTMVEGNLAGENAEGPSIRTAAIVNNPNGKLYLVGTSRGLFSTTDPNGNTTWLQESPEGIGATIVSYLDARVSDSRIAAATHGRGMWFGDEITVSVNDESDFAPKSIELSQNYPNPFNPTTNINFTLPTASDVELTVYNSLGKEVKKLISENRPEGVHSVSWNATDNSGRKVSSGVYFYKLTTGDFVDSRKMILLK
ncbi:MAG: T9SS type A sorting domain-containing protein [Melioribacteraceae bacterium]|nr:T9SS type A sorting domain-containing protein [Melioribacteraceae bacterium]MCF8266321.1 T9SS type A sorting domain-containing protein [Melioribacteraceae bacterium]MCF8414137.1 T9SS type A sorting domain-containing protein [Melioribacteraceae bacterium]